MAEVTQADREAAVAYLIAAYPEAAKDRRVNRIAEGQNDADPSVQAFAAHRRTNDQAKDEEIARLKGALAEVSSAAFALSIESGMLSVALDGQQEYRRNRQAILAAMKAMEQAFAKHGEALKDKPRG